MKKYIVAYVLEFLDGDGNTDHETEYEPFFSEDSETNYKNAVERYQELINNEDTYSANLTEIIESTDY